MRTATSFLLVTASRMPLTNQRPGREYVGIRAMPACSDAARRRLVSRTTFWGGEGPMSGVQWYEDAQTDELTLDVVC